MIRRKPLHHRGVKIVEGVEAHAENQREDHSEDPGQEAAVYYYGFALPYRTVVLLFVLRRDVSRLHELSHVRELLSQFVHGFRDLLD